MNVVLHSLCITASCWRTGLERLASAQRVIDLSKLREPAGTTPAGQPQPPRAPEAGLQLEKHNA
ncbi:hypothetical protein [Acidocella sp.]|jgi:hypothetical protein|uniref:hypothetical protein n=1 Tax=Acidocella sp. TaxID=50710 RepID=UPI002639D25B|nr:hypothetical protein [Acidocella sp.]